MAAWASPAAANDLFNLDSHAVSAGNLIEDSEGNAYVSWLDSASGPPNEIPKFCKIPAGGTCTNPITLPIPGTPGKNEPDQVHPVFGSGDTVYVVGPSYIGSSVVIWTSTNGGESFNSGTVSTSGYTDQGEPNSVLLSGSEFLIGTSHVGVGFDATPVGGGASSGFDLNVENAVYSLDASLGLANPGNPVEVYWEFVNTSPIDFSRYKGSGSLTSASDWTEPAVVTKGEDPRLAGGSSGLFLVSDDISGASSEPETVDVRKYTGSGFGGPLTLVSERAFGGQTGGAITQSPDGHLAVAWPSGSAGSAVMQLFTSGDGGASFGPATDIAHIGSGFLDGDNAQISLNNNGGGWLTYRDSEGLQVANLSPLTGPAQETPPPYSGKTHTITTPVEGNLLTLKVPGMCLEALQPFYVGVGKKARHRIARALRTKMKVAKVTFSFNGTKKTLKKKPFRWLITPGPLTPGQKYTVKARVTALVKKHGHTKRVVKTLKGQVSVC